MGDPVTSAGGKSPPTSGRQAQPPWDPGVRLPSPWALQPPLLSQGQLPGPTCSHPFNSCLDPQECPQECAPPTVHSQSSSSHTGSQDMTLPQTKSQHRGFPSWAPTENRGCGKDSPPAAFCLTWVYGLPWARARAPLPADRVTCHSITLPMRSSLAGLSAQQWLMVVTPYGASCQVEEGSLRPSWCL